MGLAEPQRVRRAPTRRAPVPQNSTKRKEKRPSWFAQSLGVSAAALALFLFLSLLSLEYRTGSNLMGPIGKLVATLSMGAMGHSAYLLVCWLAVMSVRLWWKGFYSRESVPGVLVRALGIAGMVLSFACAGALLAAESGGGSIGAAVAQPLRRFFGTWGGLLCTATLFIVSLTLVTDLSLARIWSIVKSGVASTFEVFGRILPNFMLVAIQKIWRGISFCAELFGSIFSFIFTRLRPLLTFSPAEKPKSRPRIKKSLAAFDEPEEVIEEVRDLGDIKVRRKQFDAVSKIDRVRAGKKVIKGEAAAENTDIGYFTGTYEVPSLDLLTKGTPLQENEDDRALLDKSRQIESKLKDFGIAGRVTEVHPGPVITLFEFEPAAGVKVGRIASLSDDLAMSLRAFSVRIVAPIPGKGTVGIEVPNTQRELVRLRDVLQSPESMRAPSILSVALGKDTRGDAVVSDLAEMPHLLIAGATGTGKSVCINAILLSLLYRATPLELGLIMIDPKILELSVYEGIPHLRVPVVTVPKQAKAVLEWAVNEMNRRYRMMQKLGVRSIDGYNRVVAGEEEANPTMPAEVLEDGVVKLDEAEVVAEGTVAAEETEDESALVVEELKPLPKIVIVIDELADLMLTVGREIEDLITRLAQKARASGIHIIVATQRPSVDVITGLIKANFPARLSFQVATRVDSRTIIDSMGAEKLLGKGDMLFMPPGVGHLKRLHGAFVSDTEVKKVIAALKKNCKPNYDKAIMDMCERALKEDDSKGNGIGPDDEGYDALFDQAVQIVLEKGQASTSMIQRIFRIGYNRAARIIEQMERDGIVGPADGAKPRSVIGGRAEL